ncbi:MAG TPA: NAD(P)H-hydrate dehydratase [Bacteroidetes bacterium]|nr:NAD(P)H-hydrate dehydratase [Bacteroidota bacterium]
MKIFTSAQIREIDRYTMEHEPVASIDLMERAATRLFEWITRHYPSGTPFLLVAGPGNNGGDALALSRLLHGSGYRVEPVVADISGKFSDDCACNLNRLKKIPDLRIRVLKKGEPLPSVSNRTVIVDGLFGSGLARPLAGWPAELVKQMNKSGHEIISIDIPSGMYGEEPVDENRGPAVRARYTLSFQFPKLAFLLPENEEYTGEWKVLPIGLHPEIIEKTATPWHYVTAGEDRNMLHNRKKFSHKGHYGHALFIAGSAGKMGAAVLGARACLRAGVGLLTVHVPGAGRDILQTAVPEAMVSVDRSGEVFSEISETGGYDAVGVGPGLGTRQETAGALQGLLGSYHGPVVVDADAINILGKNRDWLGMLNEKTVLTPHPREFERITRRTENSLQRLELLRQFAGEYGVVVVLKGAYTAVARPDGQVFFNSTGNPGMATAGSGDVLTGIILSLLAQGYPAGKAATLGVYLHGLSGDLASRDSSQESLIAGDIIEYMGDAFKTVHDEMPKM